LNAQFEAEIRKLEESAKGTQTEQKGEETDTKAPAKAEPDDGQTDPVQKEMDDAEAAAAAAKLEVAKEPEKKEDAEEPEPEDEDATPEGDELQSWLKTLSKPAAKRIERQMKQIAKLQASVAERITIAPTPEAPLAHVTTTEQLAAEKAHWETVRDQSRQLIAALRDDPETPLQITLADGKLHEFDAPENVTGAEAWATKVLDSVPEAKLTIQERLTSKPWETAAKIAPAIFEKDSDQWKQATEFISKNPAFKTAFPDYEVKLAHMLRSMQMDAEQKAGKARWVRLELDSQGRVKLPKKSAAPAKAPESRVPTAPATTRPAIQAAGQSDKLKSKIAALEKSGSDDDLRAAVAELVAA